MKYEDLMKKLENLKTPEIELAGHRRALRMALLNSGYFKKRPSMDWAKILAPVAAALLLIAVAGFFAAIKPGTVHLGSGQIDKFASYQELREFVKTNTQNTAYFRTPGLFWAESGGAKDAAIYAQAPSGYSTTNIQVVGVDEADIVKTDGQYIYVVSGQKVIIVKAYPAAQAQVLSEITVERSVAGIFVNGDKLVVLEQEAFYRGYGIGAEEKIYLPYVSPKTYIKVYDISDREDPQLRRELSADGQYIGSRMIGDYVYVIVNEPVHEQDGEVSLPKISVGDEEKEIHAEEIWYSNVADSYYMYTTIIAVNTQNDAQEPAYETVLLGASSNLYVSLNNIYLTFPVWGTRVGDFDKTSIHRIGIAGDRMEYVASGEVPGMVLNQFSMDEYDGYFRVATTTHGGEKPVNNVYVLNMALNITGSVTGLAPGETIYSARFMGERCYLVTFVSTDPLFVIDLSDPSSPRELGYLKITGYSSYLHPYDATHIIGIGKETVAEREDFAWYQGIKISLFDVSDVHNPKEVGEPCIIGDRGSDSPILWDHKAFLLDRNRNLMVIPVLEANVDRSQYPGEVPPEAYGKPVWQGAYVFHVSTAGIEERGRITHIDNLGGGEEDNLYMYSGLFVTRSLYIDDVLYTVSEAKIKMNSLEDLSYINEVKLSS
jgi:inhibitor of cysteine peptidase